MKNGSHKQTVPDAPDTSKSIHLSASAGSGKTRALKDRYLSLLDVLDHRGLNIDQAVAITFTDKAAAEIKERVMHDLPGAMRKKIVRGRQDLRISTIHSFCMNLLKRYPLEAGLPPDFGVLDARDQTHKIQSAIEKALEESDRDDLMAPVGDFTADELIATIKYLLSIRSKLKRMEIDAGGPGGLLKAVHAGSGIKEAVAELKTLVNSPNWKATLHQMQLILRTQGGDKETLAHEHRLLSETKDADSITEVARTLYSIYFKKDGGLRERPFLAKKDFTGKNRTEYEETYYRAQELLAQFRTHRARMQAGHEAISILRIFQLAEKNYGESKLREGLLDFDDLEIYAYRLLQGQESPDILYWLDRKILHFLVDEFQDTSDIQWAILNRLTEEIFSGQGSDKPMRPTLFVVGDEKQSIYRFREANYRLIETVRRRMEQNLPPEAREVRTLDKNFRSTPEIIGTVNQVFGSLWRETYKPSEADRKEHNGSVRLIELTSTSEEDASRGPSEADILARELLTTIEMGTIIYDKSAGWQPRPASYGDCAILIQSRTWLKEYETALQKSGVPFRVVGGIGFYEEDEIQALINILSFLWNRGDRLSLAAALKSPLFGFSDEDLYELMLNDGNMLDSLKDHKPDAWERLHEWMNLSGLVPLSGLIHKIVADTGAYVRFGRRNPQAIFNIDKLLDTAREFDRRGYTTLQDFVERVRNIREAEQREATADMNLPGFQGAVSIMTVHKAKGLEYPIVFLPGMNQAQRSVTHGPNVMIGEAGRRVSMAVKDDSNPLYGELWKVEKEELKREHQRLLYVAMTRARDHLVLIGTLVKGRTQVRQNSWLDYLHAAAPKPLFDAPYDDPAGLRIYSYHPLSRESGSPGSSPPSSRSPEGKVKKPAASTPSPEGSQQKTFEGISSQTVLDNIAPLFRSDAPEWKTATDFIEQIKGSPMEPLLPVIGPRTVSPLTRGLVLHRCLESQVMTGSYELTRTVEEFPEVIALDDKERQDFLEDIGSTLIGVLENKELAWIFERSADAYAELPFLYKKSHSLVSGIIDRVVIKEGIGFVVDYKSILIENDAALQAWTDHYRPQVRIYCEAVKEIFKLHSVEGYLLFLDSVKLEPTCIIS